MLFTERKERWTQMYFKWKQSICNIKKCEFHKQKTWAPEQQWEESLSMLFVVQAFLQVVLYHLYMWTSFACQHLLEMISDFLSFPPPLPPPPKWVLGRISIEGHKILTTESAPRGSPDLSGHPNLCFSSLMLSVIETKSTTLSLKFRWRLQDFVSETVTLS